MRSITLRLTIALAAVAVAGLALVHAQTPAALQTPPMQQTKPVQQTPAPPTPAITADVPLADIPPCPTVPPGLSDVGPLLDHISAVLGQIAGNESASVKLAAKATAGDSSTGTTGMMGSGAPTPMKVSGGTANKVSIDRDKLDEIRAEVEQIRAILKK